MTLRVLSLFSGIGAFDLGLERAGMEIIAQCEIDPFCRRVLSRHWPSVPKFDDVRKLCRRGHDCEQESEDGEVQCPRCGVEFGECDCVGTDQFTDDHGYPDIIVGGDPCQAHSNARRHGREPESLGGEFIRVVEQLRHRAVLRENPAAIRSDAEWSGERFADALRGLGYATVRFPIRACCCGADHRRSRVFVFAALQNTDGTRLEGHERQVVAGAFRGRQDADPAGSDRRHATPRVCRGVDGIANRAHRLRGIGNAVDTRVAEAIGRAIMESNTHE